VFGTSLVGVLLYGSWRLSEVAAFGIGFIITTFIVVGWALLSAMAAVQKRLRRLHLRKAIKVFISFGMSLFVTAAVGGTTVDLFRLAWDSVYSEYSMQIAGLSHGIHELNITFRNLNAESGSPFKTYNDDGIDITAISGNWYVKKEFDVRSYIYFVIPPEEKRDAPPFAGLAVTTKNRLFFFGSANIYPSDTIIQYILTGLRNGNVVLKEAGIVSGSSGQKEVIQNPKKGVLLDQVEISLSVAANGRNTNSAGLDNIRLFVFAIEGS
jgi:hypothetical protein